MGQPLYCSGATAGVQGAERLLWWLHPLRVTQQHCLASWLPGCPPQVFPNTVSSLTSWCYVSLQSTAALTCDCSTIPKLQLPATAPSRGPASLSGVCMAVARTVRFPFRLGCHRSAVSLSALNVSPLTQIIAPMWRSDPCFSSPTCWGQVQFYEHSCFPPISFIPSFVRVKIFFFSAGQVLLSAFNWSSACTSVSEGAFLIYLWKEMYSTSTYYSAITSLHFLSDCLLLCFLDYFLVTSFESLLISFCVYSMNTFFAVTITIINI